MAGVTNPDFAGFDAAAFRLAIRSTMTMAAPNATADRVTFRWSPVTTYSPQDPSHNPYSWTAPPTSSITHADVQVPVAVEFSARPAASSETGVGEFDNSRAIITILDVDYELVAGADLVLLGQNIYEVQFVAPPIGLFEVTVYQIYTVARDES